MSEKSEKTSAAEQQFALKASPSDIAKLRHLYANLKNGGVRDTAQAKRIADGLLAPIIERIEQALHQPAPVKACVCGEPQASGTVHRVDGPCYVAAPQQKAQEPVAYIHVPHHTVEGKVRPVVSFEKYQQDYSDGIYSTRIPLYTAPQPAPAPLSEMPYEKRKAIQEGEQIGASDAWFKARHEMLDTVDRRNVFRAGFDRGWSAALAAQGGKV